MSDALPAVPPLPPVLIGASSKAYLGLAELTRWVQVVTAGLGELGGGEGAAAPRAVPYLCMPAALLGPLGSTLTAAGMLVGAQDVSRFDPGAHTGETTAALLAELGASMVMIGHPERARDQHETLDECRGKALAAARNGIVPILIAGEPTRGADPETAIGPQLDVILADVTADFPVIVAYEPSWAIGQAEPAPAEHIAATTGAIRELLHARGRHNDASCTAAAPWWAPSPASSKRRTTPPNVRMASSLAGVDSRPRTSWPPSKRCAPSSDRRRAPVLQTRESRATPGGGRRTWFH